MDRVKFLKKMYSKWAIIYDLVLDKIFSFNRKQVINYLNLLDGEKIIEIGVGTGLNVKFYPKNNYIVGIDFSKDMINKAKKKNEHPKISFLHADARKLPYKKDFFDKALGTFVLRVTPEPKKVLNELSRIVKNNGLLVLCDGIKKSNSKKLNMLSKLTFFLGWGKDIDIKKEINLTSWKLLNQIRINKTNSYILVLINKK